MKKKTAPKRTSRPKKKESLALPRRLKWEMRGAYLRRVMGVIDPDTFLKRAAAARRQRAVLAANKRTEKKTGQSRQVTMPLPWISAGPANVPGRITSLAIDPADGGIVYAGSADGGVFKTTNTGFTWEAKWSQELSLAIGAVAVAPSDRNWIYASTGEWGLSDMGVLTVPGVGVYLSQDAGEQWTLLSPISSQYTNAIAIDPENSSRVFVAGDKGLDRTEDAGRTWVKIFDGTVCDVVLKPGNAKEVWIAVHERGIWRSDDGGDTFPEMPVTFPDSPAPVAPRIAFGQRGDHGADFIAVKMGRLVFTSIDGGGSFTPCVRAPDDASIDSDYPYMNVLAVHPEHEKVMFAGSRVLCRTENGGQTWQQVESLIGGTGERAHVDKQAIAISHTNPDHVYLATDGGVYDSFDGIHWIQRGALPTTQCYSVGVSQQGPFACGITTQDNQCYKSTGSLEFAVARGDEGGWIEFAPDDSATIYANTWLNSHGLWKSVNGGSDWQQLDIITTDAIHHYFNKGLTFALNRPNLLLAIRREGEGVTATCVPVARSTNGGASWTNTLMAPNLVITAIKFAPSDFKQAYAAGVDGSVWHSVDSGITWVRAEQLNLPRAWVQTIEVDWENPFRMYVAFGVAGVRQVWRGDFSYDPNRQPRWFDASGLTAETSLPDLPATALVADHDAHKTLYVSNTLGIYRTLDGGESWHPFDQDLPNCIISDLVFQRSSRTLFASTWGRGLFRRQV